MTVNGCVGSATYNDFICAESIPQANFYSNINSFSEPSQNIVFTNASNGATNYIWNMGDGNLYYTTDVEHNFQNTANGSTIWLTAISSLGCMDSTSISIPFEDGVIFYIPNTFTPDGNNFNQTFLPIFTSGFDPYNYELNIFNRWGELIFQSFDSKSGWDGSYGEFGLDAQDGTYVYKIIYKIPQDDDYRVVHGFVNLIR